MNAKQEILEHINNSPVKHVRIEVTPRYPAEPIKFEGTLERILRLLDFDYDSGYGRQYIDGIIWYEDGTWSTRGEYDGSEWWRHHRCPEIGGE